MIWCYRRMLKIRCIEMQSSNKVLQRGDLDEPQLLKTNLKQKAEFVGHVAKRHGAIGEC